MKKLLVVVAVVLLSGCGPMEDGRNLVDQSHGDGWNYTCTSGAYAAVKFLNALSPEQSMNAKIVTNHGIMTIFFKGPYPIKTDQ